MGMLVPPALARELKKSEGMLTAVISSKIKSTPLAETVAIAAAWECTGRMGRVLVEAAVLMMVHLREAHAQMTHTYGQSEGSWYWSLLGQEGEVIG